MRLFNLLNKGIKTKPLQAYIATPLVLINQNSEIDFISKIVQLSQESNIIIPLIFLWIFFGLFMLFNVFFSFAAILLITEAAMVTLILLLVVSVTTYFPNLTADVLNLLNASAMEAIIGITIVFVHQKSWKSRHTNGTNNVLESSLLCYKEIPLVSVENLVFKTATAYCVYRMILELSTRIYCWIIQMFTSVVKKLQMYCKQIFFLNNKKMKKYSNFFDAKTANLLRNKKSPYKTSKRTIHVKKLNNKKIIIHSIKKITTGVNCRLAIRPKFSNKNFITIKWSLLIVLVFLVTWAYFWVDYDVSQQAIPHDQIIFIWDNLLKKTKKLSTKTNEVVSFNANLRLTLRQNTLKNTVFNDPLESSILKNIEKITQKTNKRLSDFGKQALGDGMSQNPKDILIDFKKVIQNQKNWENNLIGTNQPQDTPLWELFHQISQIGGSQLLSLADTNSLLFRSFQTDRKSVV